MGILINTVIPGREASPNLEIPVWSFGPSE